MNEIRYNLQFEKLCRSLGMGTMTGEPEAVTGGLLHRTFAVQTTLGKYVVKALNPRIMQRPTAMRNYINSENIANLAAKNLPVAPAKRYHGRFMQQIDGQYYLIFDWVDGKSLRQDEINTAHCEKIGDALARIHATDYSGLGLIDDESGREKVADWSFYLQKGRETNAPWAELLSENLESLYRWNTRMVKAARLLASGTVLSHRDLDPKNVLWAGGTPVIIDWEAAGFIHPMCDLVDTAVNWSKDDSGSLSREKFTAFACAYQKRRGTLKADWDTVLDKGFSSNIGWLEYSLKRSLMMECTDEAEQRLGTEQAAETIRAVRRYADSMAEMKQWLAGLEEAGGR